jgi:hypothetical protein
MNFKKFAFTIFSLGLLLISHAQDTLPNFSVKNIGKGRIIISWVNNYTYTGQISIQRSYDSLSGYKSILTVPDPTTPQNGYVDTKAPTEHQFYRLFIVRENGNYLFSKAKRPAYDTIAAMPVKPVDNFNSTIPAKSNSKDRSLDNSRTDSKNQSTWNNDLTIKTDAGINNNTAKTDSNKSTEIIPPVVRVQPVNIKLDNPTLGGDVKTPQAIVLKNDPNAFAPSLYVYTHPDGNVQVVLPNKRRVQKYSIKFFDEENNLLFELKDLKNASFILDKSNFMHAGWFKFELYEDNKLLEKNKLQLSPSF